MVNKARPFVPVCMLDGGLEKIRGQARFLKNKGDSDGYRRLLCKYDLRFLCEDALKNPYWDEFHDDLQLWLDAFELEKRKLILVPRGHMKSSVVTIGKSIQKLLQNPNIRILIANAIWDNARGFVSQIASYLTSNSYLPSIYGAFKPPTNRGGLKWNRDGITINQRTQVMASATITSTGIERVQTSQHYDLIILDDIVCEENISTKEQRDKVRRFYGNCLSLLSPTGELWVIGTTWHEQDLYNELRQSKYYKTYIRTALEPPDFSGKVLFPKMFTREILEQLRAEQGDYKFCTPYEAPVLMGDFSFKPIGEIEVGDVVVGWDNVGSKEKKRRLKQTKVLAVSSLIAPTVTIKFENGHEIRCTKEHKWYTGRGNGDKSHAQYKPAGVGSKLMFVADYKIPELERKQEEGALWLGGFFDGEGSCTQSITFSQDKYSNEIVCKHLEKVLTGLNYEWRNWSKDDDTKSKRFRHKNIYWINGGLNEKIRFIKQCNPVKKQRIIDSIFRQGACFVKREDKVVEIKPYENEIVYALTTETGNYIVWGYASSNSAQYFLDPYPVEQQQFKHSWLKYYRDYPKQSMFVALTVDPSMGKENSDFAAIAVTGIDALQRVYVLEARRFKCRVELIPGEVVNTIKALEAYGIKVNVVGLESFVFQEMLYEPIRVALLANNINIYVELLPKMVTSSKSDRIRSLIPKYASGMVYHKEGEMVDLEHEMFHFKPEVKNNQDDILDALAWQTKYWINVPNEDISHDVVPNTFEWWIRQNQKRKNDIFQDFNIPIRNNPGILN